MARVRFSSARSFSLFGILALLAFAFSPIGCQTPTIPEDVQANAVGLMEAALESELAWERLSDLVDAFGPRFSGTESLEESLEWILARMYEDGLDNVRGEPVMVPRWIRGHESIELVSPRQESLTVLGLCGSTGTPSGGIRGEVLVVESFQELEARAGEAKGRIVLFDVPFTAYGETVQYRSQGAVAAARVGAVASLIRSVTPFSMNTPHTG